MIITFNGKTCTIPKPCTILQFLETSGKASLPMMVKLNGSLIQQKDLKDFWLKEHDVLSVVLFMGGG
ncbi:MAG: sulfur carrier protein ThiS [Spirochaetia bacterium]|nr:sulfur carrier protein ThiS [Spirochaetia bacterium]